MAAVSYRVSAQGVRPRRAHTLEDAALKAEALRFNLRPGVIVVREDGAEVPEGDVAAAAAVARRRRRVARLRGGAWALIIQTSPFLLLFAFAFAGEPAAILEFWRLILLFVLLPAGVGILLLHRARRLAQTEPLPPAR